MGKSVESYAHRSAKRIVVSWLRRAAERAGYDECAGLGVVSWRVNRRAPHWGVWSEYPICWDGCGVSPVWDEYGGDGGRYAVAPPTYKQLIAAGRKPRVIFDIAIQHKGLIAYALEIVHKHPLDDEKLAAVNELGITTLVIQADWVLNQVRPPRSLGERFVVSQ